MGKNGLVDIYPDISKTDEREKYITYSKPIIKVNFGILTLKNRYHDGNFFNLDNLNVGYINGKTYINEILQSFNNVTEIELDNIAEVTRALTNKTIDVYIDDITVLAENRITSYNVCYTKLLRLEDILAFAVGYGRNIGVFNFDFDAR